MDKTPLIEHAFTTDAAELYTYIVSFTSGNMVAKAKMVTHTTENNGRLNFMALKDHYEGVGVYAVNAVQADKTLNDLFYSGEKKPHMWCDIFERQIINAFNIYNRL